MPAGVLEVSDVTLTALPWGREESGTGGIQGDTWAGRSHKRKALSATTYNVGTHGRPGARQGRGGHEGDRREKVGAKPSGVGGNKGGRKASGVDTKPHGVGGGVDSPQGTDTPRVAEEPRGDKTPGVPTAFQYRRGKDGRRGEGTKTHPPTKQPGGNDLMAATAHHTASEWRRQVRQWRRRRETVARAPGQSTLTAQTAPGPKTACTCPTNTTDWHQRQWREVKPPRGPPPERTAMGPQ